MKKFLMFPMLLMGVGAFAQVGINTTTPNAQLEVKSSNEATPANTDGIIIPKINTFPVVNPTAAQQGMMVYLTTTVGTRAPGFYYWDNNTTTWIGVGSNTANAWGLTGNDGTTPGNNFMGTSDDKDLVFKRNNVLAGKLQINNTSYGLNSFFSNTTGSFNASHGVFSLFSNTTGQQNAGFGAYSLWSNTVGSNNAAFGTNAMLSNTSGICNTALGVAALYGNFTGNFNTAGGFASLLTNTTGNQNAGFGAHSLRLNTTGSNNAAFGTNAMLSNTSGNNNTALGAASLKGNTTGNFNTAGGFDSLFTNTVVLRIPLWEQNLFTIIQAETTIRVLDQTL